MKILCTLIVFAALLFSGAGFAQQSRLKTGWYFISADTTGYKRQLDKSGDIYYIDPAPILLANHFKMVEVQEGTYQGKQRLSLFFRFDEVGTKAWSDGTLKAMDGRIAFVVDDVLMCAPMVRSQITSGVSVMDRGNETREGLEAIAAQIRKSM